MFIWNRRPPEFSNFNILVDKYVAYVELMEANNKIPTLQYFAVFLGTKLENLKQKNFNKIKSIQGMDEENKIKSYEFIESIADSLEAELTNVLLTGRNQVGTIFLLKNNNSYRDKTEVENISRSYSVDIED